MSLINDAIKQANKANKERHAGEPSPGGAPTTGMRSAEAHAAHPSSGSMTSLLIVVGIVVFVLLGGSLLFLSMRGTRSVEEPTVPMVTTQKPARPATPPTDEPAAATGVTPTENPVAGALDNPVPPAFDAPAASHPSTQVNTANAAPGTPSTQPTGPRPFPELKLQGIYYRLKNPSVLINGKTLEIGDLVGKARVIQIERKEVTLELDGQKKVLRLQ